MPYHRPVPPEVPLGRQPVLIPRPLASPGGCIRALGHQICLGLPHPWLAGCAFRGGDGWWELGVGGAWGCVRARAPPPCRLCVWRVCPFAPFLAACGCQPNGRWCFHCRFRYLSRFRLARMPKWTVFALAVSPIPARFPKSRWCRFQHPLRVPRALCWVRCCRSLARAIGRRPLASSL